MSPPASMPPRPSWVRNAARATARAAFACVPLVSFGYLTGPAFACAAIWMRSWRLGMAAGAYFAIAAAICGFSQGTDTTGPSSAMIVGFGVNIVLGTVHAAFVQQRLFRDPMVGPPQDPAVAAALARRQRRTHARGLLAQDPALAAELCIGRPDLRRQFDDGGLIDINHVPAPILNALPGIGPQEVERIAATRQRGTGLTCVEDLVVFADVPGEVAESLRDMLVFRPLSP
jgi:hypothetical protein